MDFTERELQLLHVAIRTLHEDLQSDLDDLEPSSPYRNQLLNDSKLSNRLANRIKKHMMESNIPIVDDEDIYHMSAKIIANDGRSIVFGSSNLL